VDEGLNDRRGKYVARLKGAKRQKNQLVLAFGTQMTKVCQRENLWQAFKRVKGNGGSPGIDGMTVDDFADYLKPHWILHSFVPTMGLFVVD
jgi:hypothetical protein